MSPTPKDIKDVIERIKQGQNGWIAGRLSGLREAREAVDALRDAIDLLHDNIDFDKYEWDRIRKMERALAAIDRLMGGKE